MYWNYFLFAAIEAYWKFLMKVVFVCVCILYTVYLFIWINGFNIEIKCMFRRFTDVLIFLLVMFRPCCRLLKQHVKNILQIYVCAVHVVDSLGLSKIGTLVLFLLKCLMHGTWPWLEKPCLTSSWDLALYFKATVLHAFVNISSSSFWILILYWFDVARALYLQQFHKFVYQNINIINLISDVHIYLEILSFEEVFS